jgi:hypothetical protein
MPVIKLFLSILIIIGCNAIHDSQAKDPYENNPLAKGCNGAVYPKWDISAYVLPYPVGKLYRVNLSSCDGSYHSQGLPDQFAIDFDMAIGTLITAARAGVVAEIEENGIDGNHPNNYVIIDHGDSTYGYYMHLTKNGAIVNKGDTVKAGDHIAYSGNTGLAGYPHLHFVVVKDSYFWPYVSVPVTFRNTYQNIRGLVKGFTYEALKY